MKSIFLISPDSELFDSVYSESVRSNLHRIAALSDEVLISAENIDKYADFVRDTEYIFSTWHMPVFSAEQVRRYFPKLKAVFYAAGSVKHFADAYVQNGVRIFSAYAANAIPVAQYTAAQIVLANKGFFSSCRINNTGDYYDRAKSFRSYRGNYKSNIALLGAGAIGRLVIEYLSQYELNIFVYDPFLSDAEAARLGVVKESLDFIFKNCSVISNHLADVPETRGIIDSRLLNLLAPYSVLINTGRGAQLDEAALIKRLSADKTITALLDVTAPEPPTESSPLYTFDNVYLTPHIAGASGNEFMRLAEYMTDEFVRFTSGGKTRYEITAQMLEHMA